jgi:hypothetical protein
MVVSPSFGGSSGLHPANVSTVSCKSYRWFSGIFLSGKTSDDSVADTGCLSWIQQQTRGGEKFVFHKIVDYFVFEQIQEHFFAN